MAGDRHNLEMRIRDLSQKAGDFNRAIKKKQAARKELSQLGEIEVLPASRLNGLTIPSSET